MSRRRLVIEADGGSRGNPGKAGYGALVRDADTGAVLFERAESVGIASNNVAEYSGLVAGLEAVMEIDPAAEVEVRMDSKLVVEQMSGRWKIKHEDMRRLALQAQEVAGRLRAAGGSVSYTWIPRAMNSAADALANAAMDGRTISRRLDRESVPDPTPQLDPTPELDPTTALDVVPEHGPGERVGPDGERRPTAAAATAFPAFPTRPDLGPPARIVLVRHGLTDFTVAGRLDGRGGADPSLNRAGREQAAAAAAAVRGFVGDGPVQVVTSTLARAVQTGAAVAAALGVDADADPDWDEQGFGDWDGKSMGQISARFPQELLQLRGDVDYARPGGESHAELEARVLQAFGRAAAGSGTVVVATHRKPIMIVLTHLLGIPHDRIWRLATAPASLTAVEVWADGAASVAFVNDTSHLRHPLASAGRSGAAGEPVTTSS